jgi:hypothetical protein
MVGGEQVSQGDLVETPVAAKLQSKDGGPPLREALGHAIWWCFLYSYVQVSRAGLEPATR